MNVLSPLTHAPSVTFEEKLDSKRIIAQYKAQYAFDPSAYFENMDGVALYRCNETGYRFFYPPRMAGDSELYKHLQKFAFYYASWRWEYDLVNKHITEKDYVLEVGCGFGLFLQRLCRWNVPCAGLEFNPRAVETTTSKGLQVYPETIHDHARNNPGKYSVVCAFHVLEHIGAAGDFIGDCLKAIRPYGKLIISVPNNNPFLFRHDKYHTLNLPPHHMGLWDKKSLKNLQKVFPLRACVVRTEPLFDRGSYFRAQLEYLSSKSPRLGRLADRIFQPYQEALMRVVARFVAGRNVFAIYTRLPESDPR